MAPTAAVVSVAALALAAGCRGEPPELDARSAEVTTLAAPRPPVVMPNADTPAKYAAACGLTGSLPALGTAAAPVRGINDVTKVGVLASNGWTLIEHFDKDSVCLASAATLFANLWHKNEGGRDWYYLYRYADPDPTKVQGNLNGILGFDADSICAFDRIDAATPPADIAYLYYAGQFDNVRAKMDDCSDCHVMGYNAPRSKTFFVAKGNTDGKKPYLTARWIGAWKRYAADFGPVWMLGKATAVDAWTSSAGAALVAPPAECDTCHGTKWAPTRNRQPGMYCEAVFAKAFDGNGSMTKEGSPFSDNATCKQFLSDIGCGPGRPGGGADLSAGLCPAPFAPLLSGPIVNDQRIYIASVYPISAGAVEVEPAHNSGIAWVNGLTSLAGDPWVSALQVWGGPYPGSSTAPLSAAVSVGDPDFLPGAIPVALSPGGTYQLQLKIFDVDGTSSFSPLQIVTMPPLPDGGPWPDAGPDGGNPDGGPPPDAPCGDGGPIDAAPGDGGPCPDGGPPDGGVPDGGGPDSGVPDGGMPDGGGPDSGVPDGGVPDGPCWDAGPDGGPCWDGGLPDARLPDAGWPDAIVRDAITADAITADAIVIDRSFGGLLSVDGIGAVRAPAGASASAAASPSGRCLACHGSGLARALFRPFRAH